MAEEQKHGDHGTKDLRSLRPTTMAEANRMANYEPWEVDTPECLKERCGDKLGIGCGNTREDLLLISACLGTLWTFVMAFFGLLTKAALDTDEKHTALWIYFWFGLFFFFAVGGAVSTGQMQRAAQDKAQDQLAELKAQLQAAREAGFI